MSSSRRRTAYEPGHRAKFLVVVDETAECDRAVYFAARRALRTGVGVTLLCVISSAEFQTWLGVGEALKAEAEDDANSLLDEAEVCVRSVTGAAPERIIRAGLASEEVLRLIEEDTDIALLVLAAGTDSSGPGPLVSLLASSSGPVFPIPVAIVPGGLSDGEIDAVA
ncbi:universal stress protein [Chelatococcus reniformis]|uniref:Universal stress protein A n=1 Tax=Chelatococcus reniformis TaxID=1494448 RepID=A0A916X8X9_9HYPH|nr:universal stress protein [Chelatococcus reniformis]GGC52022.1 universal stress protein A [Chelatococcus reniformis]